MSSSPAANDFTNAYALRGLSVTTNGNNLEATKEPGEPTGGDSSADASVWYSWTAPAAGGVAVSIGENYYGGHPFGVYRGDSLSNLISRGESIYGFYAVNFVAHKGEKYYMEATGFSDEIPDGFGPFTLSIVQTPAPANDDFTNRIALSGTSVSATGSNVAATVEPGEPGTSPSVWWTWTAPGTEVFFIPSVQCARAGPTIFAVRWQVQFQICNSLRSLARRELATATDAFGEVHVVEGRDLPDYVDRVIYSSSRFRVFQFNVLNSRHPMTTSQTHTHWRDLSPSVRVLIRRLRLKRGRRIRTDEPFGGRGQPRFSARFPLAPREAVFNHGWRFTQARR